MSPVSRGFRHFRRAPDGQEDRVPPGQYVTDGFPVLSAGPTPHTPLQDWTFSITQAGQTTKSWTWQEFRALPAETVTVDVVVRRPGWIGWALGKERRETLTVETPVAGLANRWVAAAGQTALLHFDTPVDRVSVAGAVVHGRVVALPAPDIAPEGTRETQLGHGRPGARAVGPGT